MYFLAIVVIPLVCEWVMFFIGLQSVLYSLFGERKSDFVYGLIQGFLNVFLAYLLFHYFDVNLTFWLSVILAGLKLYGGFVRVDASSSLEMKKDQVAETWGALIGIGISTFIFIV